MLSSDQNRIARPGFFLFPKGPCTPMPPLIRRLLRAAFYLASALVFALSLMPAAALPSATIGDKAEHLIAYALLGLLGGVISERGVLRTILALAAFGIAIELLQTFSPGRSAGVLDALVDIAGVCLGCGAAAALRHMTSMFGDRAAGREAGRRAPIAGSDAEANSASPRQAPAHRASEPHSLSN